MQCLIDLDILLFEISSLGQYIDEDTEEVVMKSFERVSEMFDQRVAQIEEECWADKESLFFMTDNRQLHERREVKKAKELLKLQRRLARNPTDRAAELVIPLYQPSEYSPNFRDKVAKKKVYKGDRKGERPLHYVNLVEYACATRDVTVAQGLEADDLLAMHQHNSPPLSTIICTRDKDLRMVEGMHFGWSCGNQLQFGPEQVSRGGSISLSSGNKKLSGTGLVFFYSQVLTGDPTDCYPGLPRCGPVKAFKLLGECDSEEEMFNAVYEAYKSFYGEDHPHEEMEEQCHLAWMVRERNEDGSLKHYVMYDER